MGLWSLVQRSKEKTMITYSLSGRKNALELTRKIYRYKDSSNYDKYTYMPIYMYIKEKEFFQI